MTRCRRPSSWTGPGQAISVGQRLVWRRPSLPPIHASPPVTLPAVELAVHRVNLHTCDAVRERPDGYTLIRSHCANRHAIMHACGRRLRSCVLPPADDGSPGVPRRRPTRNRSSQALTRRADLHHGRSTFRPSTIDLASRTVGARDAAVVTGTGHPQYRTRPPGG